MLFSPTLGKLLSISNARCTPETPMVAAILNFSYKDTRHAMRGQIVRVDPMANQIAHEALFHDHH